MPLHPRDKGPVLVTGASSGIGRACALLLAGQGYCVFAGVRNLEAGVGLKAEASGHLYPVRLDITSSEQIDAAVEIVVAHSGSLVGLVNNAGIVLSGPLEFFPLSELRRILEINVFGQMAVSKAFLPLLRRSKGCVIQIGSPSGYLSPPFLGAYAASKFALEALIDALRRETALFGLRVSLVEPGAIETPVWEKSLSESEKLEAAFSQDAQDLYSNRLRRGREMMLRLRRRAIKPERVARVVLRALEARCPRPRYFVGMDARMQYFLAHCIPDRFVDSLLERFFNASA